MVDRRNLAAIVLCLVVAGATGFAGGCGDAPPESEYVGSVSCRSCHERFYELWESSHHGRAMQPFTPELAREALTEPTDEVVARGRAYGIEFDETGGRVVERSDAGDVVHPIAHAMGGKNVYYFLTPRERGRLQVLPVAYDVRERAWFDTTTSMLRHAPGHSEEPLAWTDPLLTFNTACWSCHVSQMSVNYDPATDTYRSEWREPGINCETCHGPAGEHVRVCVEAGDTVPKDLRILSWRTFTPEQINDACAPCHAKMEPLTGSFRPGDRFFDHFDLTTLEDPDFRSDGRDIGENYTYTQWRMNPCATRGDLHCLHCHTSSGRTRFDGEDANRSCLPCHAERVEASSEHTGHPSGSRGDRCVSCHMPSTEFARMHRSDHSMRPPRPWEEQNPCTNCHGTGDPSIYALWREHSPDEVAEEMAARTARLVRDARARDKKALGGMIAYLNAEGCDEITRTSLIRLLAPYPTPRKVPALWRALRDPSPLVRAAAARGLTGHARDGVLDSLLGRTADEVRLVRVRVAEALVGVPLPYLSPTLRGHVDRAMAELEASFDVRPDSWTGHYNRGNHLAAQGRAEEAVAAFREAADRHPEVSAPLVNASVLLAQLGRPAEAEAALRRALDQFPNDGAAHFNLALLLAETERAAEAIPHLRKTSAADPNNAAVAYNLGVLLIESAPEEAVAWLRRAHESDPHSAKYGYAYAHRLHARSRDVLAVSVLERTVNAGGADVEVYSLWGLLLDEANMVDEAIEVYRRASRDERLPSESRNGFARRADALDRR